MNQNSKRLLKIQRQLHWAVRAEVRRQLGDQPREIRTYYESYKREFRKVSRVSSKEDLLEACRKADIILVGDYHTFSLSQKAFEKLFADLAHGDYALTLGLEAFHSTAQAHLNLFLAGKMKEKEFLEKTNYKTSWGFRWQPLAKIFSLAKEKSVGVLGLNSDVKRLGARDEHAAQLLGQEFHRQLQTNRKQYPKFLILFGDLHLANAHLPHAIRAALKNLKISAKILTVFQNSETLYFKMAQNHSPNDFNVVRLDTNRFCIMSAPPWAKLQSLLDWNEHTSHLEEDGRIALADDVDGVIPDLILEKARYMLRALDLKIELLSDFEVKTAQSDSLDSILANLPRDQKKVARYGVFFNRPFFLFKQRVIYVPDFSQALILDAAATLLLASVFKNALIEKMNPKNFSSNLLLSALRYFLEKTVNHHRKCDYKEDLRKEAARKLKRGALPQERFSQKSALLALEQLQALQSFASGGRLELSEKFFSPAHSSSYLDAVRRSGAILGERLFARFSNDRKSIGFIQELFSKSLIHHPEDAISEILAQSAKSLRLQTSKEDIF